MEMHELSDEIRAELLELANALSYDGGEGDVEIYEPYDEYDASSIFGALVKSPNGPTFGLSLTNGDEDPLSVQLFDGTSLPVGITETPAGRNAQIAAWARGGNPLAIRSFKVSTESQATRDALIFTIGKITPFGGTWTNEITPLEFITEKDYSTTIATVPASFVIDGFTFLRFAVPAGETISLVFYVGAVKDSAAALRGVKPALPVKEGLVRVQPALPRRVPGITPTPARGGKIVREGLPGK